MMMNLKSTVRATTLLGPRQSCLRPGNLQLMTQTPRPTEGKAAGPDHQSPHQITSADAFERHKTMFEPVVPTDVFPATESETAAGF
jgi:hypothetical protein